MSNSDDEDWDSEFGVDDVPQVSLSLQRKLTIGNLSKRSKSKFDLASLLNEPGQGGAQQVNGGAGGGTNGGNPFVHPTTPGNSLPGTPVRGSSDPNNNNNNNNTSFVSRFMESDDDDWDSLDSPTSKSILQGRKEESDEEDWDAEFGGGVQVGKLMLGSPSQTSRSNSPVVASGGVTGSSSPSGVASPQMKILGIKADPNQKTEWDDDFLFNDNSESDNKLPQPNILSRVRSGPAVNNLIDSNKLPQSIHELVTLIPFVNEVDEKQLFINPNSNDKPSIPQNKIAMDLEFKKNLESLTKQLESKQQSGGAKLEISKIYYEMGLKYQQYQQQIISVFNQFSNAQKIYQEYMDDFDTPLDENNNDFEVNLYYQLGVTQKLMANLFLSTEYLKKSLEIASKEQKRFSTIYHKVNLELGISYMTTDTPIYATKYFETLLRSVLFSHCPNSIANSNSTSGSNLISTLSPNSPSANSHQHIGKECLSSTNLAKFTVDQWFLTAIGFFQLGKTIKTSFSNDLDLSLSYLKASIYAFRKYKSLNNNIAMNSASNHQLSENEIIALINEVKKLINTATVNNISLETSDLTTAKDFESDDDDEDWDAELGLNVEEERPILQLTGQSPAVATTSGKDRMPAHYKLLDSINGQTFEIVKYAKPSYLYSLTTAEGHLFLHEEALTKWLSDLIVKHLQGEDRALRVVSKASLDELIMDFDKSITQMKISTKQWARTNLEFCFTLHLFGHDETCWDTIYKFFLDIRDYSTTNQQKLRSSFMGANNTLKPSTVINNPPSSPGGSSVIDEKEAIYHYALQLLYLASKLWNREADSDYKHMCNGLKGLSSVNSPLVDLVMAECYSHHLYHRSRSQSIDSDDISEISDAEDSEEEPELGRPGQFQNEEEKLNPIQIFLKAYHTCNIRLQQQTNVTAANTYRSIPADKEYYEIGSKNAMARALVDIHFYLNGISPLTTKRLDDNVVNQVEANTCLELLDANVRMKILTDLYPELPPTYLKAKAAYALGLNAVDVGDLILAEKFFFECLYIIDQVKAPAFGLPLVLSELAANASISYASVLLDNFKYQYSIISFDNALLNLNLRKKPEYHALLRRVAALARENDDINTSIYYYKQILNNYLEDNPQSKTNEIIYICGVISTLYWEKGNYKQSEEYLKVVYFILSRPTTPNLSSSDSGGAIGSSRDHGLPKFDNPIFFTHQLNLAKLYLESYHYEKGLELLEYMKKQTLPHGKMNQLIFLLAKAYTKKGWFNEANTLLSQVENEDSHISSSTNSFISSLSGGSGTGSGFSVPSAAGLRHGSGGAGNNIERNLNYWELKCINYYHFNKFAEALVCIECAIESCPSSSLASRGQFFYIRGKVFQKLISVSSATLITFPTNLRPTGDEWKEIIDVSTSTTYNCTGDFIQECIASYKRAYHYYKTVGDDVKIQKIVSRIAETYLDRLFGPVALLHTPFDNISRLSHFPTSKLIQKDSEQEQQLSDLKKRKLKKDSLRVSSTSESSSSSTHSSLNSTPPPPKEFFITLELIENPATLALDINIDTCNILQLQRNYLNMAELKLLQGDRDLAIGYWNECKDLYFTLFFDGPNLIMKSAPLQFLKKIFAVSKRMLRFLFAFDQEMINKNLMLVDSFLNLEIDITQASQRIIESNKPFSYESNPQIEKIFVPYAYQSLTIGKTFKKNRMEVSFSVSKNQKLNDFIHSISAPPKPNNNRHSLSSPSSITNLTFGEKTKDEEKSAITGDDVGEKVWGVFHYIENEIHKYSIGKVTQEELSTKNKVLIKQILKVMQSYKNHLANTNPGASGMSPPGSPSIGSSSSSGSSSPVPISSVPLTLSTNNLASLFRSQTKSNLMGTPSGGSSGSIGDGRGRTPSNAGPTGTISKSMASKYEEISFNTNASRVINASLQKLVFSLQIDNYFIHYVPSTGRKRLNRIGKTEEILENLPPPSPFLYLEIYIFTNANEKVSFVVSPLISVERILLHLFNKTNWEVDDLSSVGSTGKKKLFSGFGSINKSNQNSFKDSPKFVDKTDQFQHVLLEFLNRAIGDPNGDSILSHSPTSGSSVLHPPDSPPQERSHNNKDFTKGGDHHHHLPVISLNNNNSNVHHSHSNTQPHLPHSKDLLQDAHGRSMSVGSNSSTNSSNLPNLPHKYYTKEQLSNLSFAKHMMRSHDPNLPKSYVTFDQVNQPLSKVFSHREMRECTEQNPLQLFIFVKVPQAHDPSSSSTPSAPSTPTSKSAGNPNNNNGIQTIYEALGSMQSPSDNQKGDLTFSNDITMSFLPLLSLSSQSKDAAAEDNERRKAVAELRQSFSSLLEILPQNTDKYQLQSSTSSTSSASSAKKSQPLFGFFSSSKQDSSIQPSANISTTPLLFICSKNLQIFPWELIFTTDLFVVRYLSLYDVLRTNYQLEDTKDTKIIPSFISVCNSVIEKTQNNDPQKKEYSLKSILYNLYTTCNIPSANRIVNENHVYRSPLVKIGGKPAIAKKKYKYVDFFDLATEKPYRISQFIDRNIFSESNNSFPVLLFTYNDLVDLSQIPIIMLKSRPLCSVLFIPNNKHKEILSKLCKIYDNYLQQASKSASTSKGNLKITQPITSSKKERYQFLVSTVQILKEEFNTPIVFFNPLFYVNND